MKRPKTDKVIEVAASQYAALLKLPRTRNRCLDSFGFLVMGLPYSAVRIYLTGGKAPVVSLKVHDHTGVYVGTAHLSAFSV
jgi:hypothetical protein